MMDIDDKPILGGPGVERVRSVKTISDYQDYVRDIAYSQHAGLYSICDNGEAKLFDVNKETIV